MSERASVRSEKTQQSQVDPETTERFIAEKRIGERIKRLRLKKSMGLVELGKRAGLSASFLSQLETGHVVPTLRNLARIGLVFSKDLSYFFESEPEAVVRIHRRKERVRLPQTGVETPGYFFESLGYLAPDRQMDPYLAEFVPQEKQDKEKQDKEKQNPDKENKKIQPEAHMHAGVEFLYVLEGELELRHGSQKFTLESGDAAYFDSGAPHAYRCAGAEPARAVIVTLHQAPAAGPPPAAGTARTAPGEPHSALVGHASG